MSDITLPTVGDGVSMKAGSDYYPYTVIAVSKSGRKITVQRDMAVRTDSNGYGGEQEWEITPDPSGTTTELSLRKDGYFHTVGCSMEWWNRWLMGRRRYCDPHV